MNKENKKPNKSDKFASSPSSESAKKSLNCVQHWVDGNINWLGTSSHVYGYQQCFRLSTAIQRKREIIEHVEGENDDTVYRVPSGLFRENRMLSRIIRGIEPSGSVLIGLPTSCDTRKGIKLHDRFTLATYDIVASLHDLQKEVLNTTSK